MSNDSDNPKNPTLFSVKLIALCKLYVLVMVLPVTSCEAEQSFSTLCRM